MRKAMHLARLAVVAMVAVGLSGCSYNKFTTQEETIKSAWAEVQNQIQRRNDLIPNLVATKTMPADAGVVAGVVREAPELMHFLTEGTIATGSLHGEVALLGTFGGLAPKKSWAIVDAANNGRHREAVEIGP